jgi:alpha,alpha-trehalase
MAGKNGTSAQHFAGLGFSEASLAGVSEADTLTPADRYQELFVEVQTARIFSDSKTFVDCAPRRDPRIILETYRQEKPAPHFDLAAFVQRHFEPPPAHDSHYVSDPDQSLPDHIDSLWAVLTQHPDNHPARSSLLPLPNKYVVPGGRFGELYYWDSYFTMLGLAVSGRHDLLRAMADNFAYLIDTYGHVPNGTRNYYLSRSQPPLFILMVELFERHGVKPAVRYLHQLRKEYDYWMDGAEQLQPGEARRHVVCLEHGAVLNRYWDDRDTPREESYAEDVATAQVSGRPVHEVWRDLRAAAESGWDFSSRWLAQPDRLGSIRTTAILPVDLNAFLHKLESKLADLSEATGDPAEAARFRGNADRRRLAMNKLLWDEGIGAFLDYDWMLGERRPQLNAAALAPLFVGLASAPQAGRTADIVRALLLDEGGIATTQLQSGQQWDQPNGWAPLQWIGISGLRDYGLHDLANDIAHRWLKTVSGLYSRESKLVEKYALCGGSGSGGEYPLQDGFGWTNGVTRKLLELYPDHDGHRCKAPGKRRSKRSVRGLDPSSV